jgi:dolichol-phosphate mannosyltransferase
MPRTRRSSRPRLVVVTPVYDERSALPVYVDEVRRTLLGQPDMSTRVLLIDDGSRDGSWTFISDLASRDGRFRGVRLSRNYGSHVALAAGFAALDEDFDLAVVLACDLQDPPSVVRSMVGEWRRGADVVWGVREAREDPWFRVAASRVFEACLRRWAMPPGSLFSTGSFVLLDRKVVTAVRQMPERRPITFALVAWTGFEQARVGYERAQRVAGRSRWRFRGLVEAMYSAFVGFSSLPIRLMKLAAVGAACLGVGMVFYLLLEASTHRTAPGWVSQMLLLSVFFTIQFALTALIGEYLARIYAESVGRPRFFVSDDTGTGGCHR